MKRLVIFLLAILIIVPTIQDVSAETLFLTSDNLIDPETDYNILSSIANFIEEISNGDITVIVDSQAPGPGEGTRAITSSSDISVTIAAACAGNFLEEAEYSANSDKQIIFVNSGNFNLDHEDSLRRAWDDNYSNITFAGLNNPGKFLNDAGIDYIQPLQEYPDAGSNGYLDRNDEEINRYIAEQIVESVNSYSNSTEKNLNTDLIVKNTLEPSVMAAASQAYLNSDNNKMTDTYNSYTAPQLLYLTSSYLGSNGLSEPKDYEEPSSPLKYSLFVKDSYSIYDYMTMGDIVSEYMDINGKAPDYISYNGAYISYYDLQYNFAKLTENHTDPSSMDFEREYPFEKVNDSILVNLLPILLIIIAILFIILIIKRVKIRK